MNKTPTTKPFSDTDQSERKATHALIKTRPTATQKPFLKWAGGKSKLTAFIDEHIPNKNRTRLIEPFAGSAAVSLALEFDAYLINDSNPDLINLFVSIQAEADFIDYAKSLFTDQNNQETRYYELREQFNQSQNTLEKSALFIYLNRHAFNGLCRYNSKGQFNVPFGRYKRPHFPEAELLGFRQKSAKMTFSCKDFQNTMLLACEQDMIYCDPPYIPLSQTASFTAYAKTGFDLSDQKRLAQQAWHTSGKTQGVLISNHDTPLAREIYHNAQLASIEVQRNIAAKSSSRQKIKELLAIYQSKHHIH